jgi:hypothetical protein
MPELGRAVRPLWHQPPTLVDGARRALAAAQLPARPRRRPAAVVLVCYLRRVRLLMVRPAVSRRSSTVAATTVARRATSPPSARTLPCVCGAVAPSTSRRTATSALAATPTARRLVLAALNCVVPLRPVRQGRPGVSCPLGRRHPHPSPGLTAPGATSWPMGGRPRHPLGRSSLHPSRRRRCPPAPRPRAPRRRPRRRMWTASTSAT